MYQKTAVNSHDALNVNTVSSISASWEYLLMDKMKPYTRCAGYPRNSDPRKKDSATLESQEKEIRRYIEKMKDEGYVLETGCMYPEAMTAYMLSYRERPQLMKLLNDAKHGKFDVVIVTEFSRLSRRMSEQAVIISILEDMGIRVESVTEHFDDSALGQFMRAAAAFSSESEREKIFWRTQRGSKDRASVALSGGGKATYGYSYIDGEKYKRARYVPNETIIWVDENGTEWSEAGVVRFIFNELKQGISIRQVRLELTRLKVPTRKGGYVWADSTVHYIATREAYKGRAVNNRYGAKNKKVFKKPEEEHIELEDGIIPPLIDEDTWNAVQERIKENKQLAMRNNKHPEIGMLRGGIIRCSYCGWSMTLRHGRAHPTSPVRWQYGCSRHDGGEERRQNHTLYVSIPLADEFVWSVAVSYIRQPENVRARVDDLKRHYSIETHSDIIQSQIDGLIARRDNLLAMAEIATDKDTIATLQGRLSVLEKERRDLYSLLVDETVREEMNYKIMEEITRFEKWVENVTPTLGNAEYEPDIEEKRLACRILGIRATVHPAGVKQRITVAIAPPGIIKALEPLIKLTQEERDEMSNSIQNGQWLR